MSVLREWLFGITGAAMLVALAESLMPHGTIQKAGKLTGGLILMIAVIQPVHCVDYTVLSESFSRYRQDLGTYDVQPQTSNFQIMKSIIEAKSAAYIQDKAEGLGAVCEVTVCCSAEDIQSYPYPVETTVFGELSDDQIAQLKQLIEAELAIPPEKQQYLKK